MWAESAGPGRGSTFHFTMRAPVARAARRHAARLHRRPAGAAGQAHPGRRRQRHQSPHPGAADGQVGHARRGHRGSVEGARHAGSAIGSTWPSSTCTCPAWTAARWRPPRAPPGTTLPLVLFSSLGRREDTDSVFAAALAKPLRQSQLFDCLVDAARPRRCAEGRARRRQAEDRRHSGSAPSAANPPGRGQRRQPEARPAPAAADGLSRRPGVERRRGDRVARPPALRRRPDGRADAGDGRARGDAAHHRALAGRAVARASSR